MKDTLPTEDEKLGMAWWNTLSEAERRLGIAGSAKASDAWAAFKRSQRSSKDQQS
jgi:hypothetical protein